MGAGRLQGYSGGPHGPAAAPEGGAGRGVCRAVPNVIDCVESKVFGIGLESYTVGSNDFYIGYGASRGKIVTLDTGHFHPTEIVADKISSLLLFIPEVMLHVSRPVRWDSDHVTIMNDDTLELCKEIVRCDALDRVHIGLDYFDARSTASAPMSSVRAPRRSA